MAQVRNPRELEETLGYSFKNCEYLLCALTHPSYANEQRLKGIVTESYERLEFLGDAVLETVISEHLFKSFKKRREGSLTSMRQRLVCEKTLAKIAAELNLNDYLCLGCGNEFKSILISVDNSLSQKNIALFPCKPPVRALSYIKCLLKHQFSSVQFSHSVMSNSLQPHESQHTRPPCPSPTPRVHPNPYPSSR